jgi:hypothetical protein
MIGADLMVYHDDARTVGDGGALWETTATINIHVLPFPMRASSS